MVYFKFGILVLCAVLAQISGQSRILEETPHYTIREYTGEPTKINYVSGVSYKLTEITPTNVTVPEDNGGNFGDLDFKVYDGELIARDTIITKSYNTSVEVLYRRQKIGYTATAINVLNFGRERGATHYAMLSHSHGIWETQILVAPGKQIRMFIESYGVPKTDNTLSYYN